MLKHLTELMLAPVTMKLLLRAKCFQRLAIPGSVRALHKDHRTGTPQNFSSYESMKQAFKLEVPEYFNFAKDVLDEWTNMEKVWSRVRQTWFQRGVCPRAHWVMSEDSFVAVTWGRVCADGERPGVLLNVLLMDRTVPHSKGLHGSTC